MSVTYIPPGTVFTGRNECDVLTLYPLGVFCYPTNIVFKNDGQIELVITGGTQPYSIYWTDIQLSGVSYGNYIRYDLSAGTYTAIVSDFYGDFVETITCTVNAPTPTPSKTPRPTPTPFIPPINCPLICFKLIPKPEAACGSLVEIYLQFTSTTIDSNGYMVWECTGTLTNPIISGVDYTGYQIRKDVVSDLWRLYDPLGLYDLSQGNPELPGCSYVGTPLQLFQIYGEGGTQPSLVWTLDYSPLSTDPRQSTFVNVYNLSVNCGICPAFTITIRVSLTQPPCEGGGIITILPQGGTGIYSYTINANSVGGIIYQSSNIFYGLAPGTYYVMVMDSIGNTSNVEVVVINHPPPPQNKTLSLLATFVGISIVQLAPPLASSTRYRVQKSYNFTVNVSPPLLIGESISFTLNHNVNSNIKPFIWVIQDPIPYQNNYNMGKTVNVVNLYKNNVFIPKTVNIVPQIYSTPTSPLSPLLEQCYDNFDLNDGGNRKTSSASTVTPKISYVNFNSGGTDVWNVTMTNNSGVPDVISGTVVTYVEESVFGAMTPNYLNWVTNTQVPHRFLNCETLNTTDTITISNVESSLDCSTLTNEGYFTFKTDIMSARNPLGPK